MVSVVPYAGNERGAVIVALGHVKILDKDMNKNILEHKRFLSKLIKIWPAIIFAVSRIDKVKGRIIFLIASPN